jgi:hypothetical protein
MELSPQNKLAPELDDSEKQSSWMVHIRLNHDRWNTSPTTSAESGSLHTLEGC